MRLPPHVLELPTSIDRSGVSSATMSAMYWSVVFFDWILPNASPESSREPTGPMPFRMPSWHRGEPIHPTALHLADGHELIAERLERLHDRFELEVRPLRGRMPRFGIHAVRHVDRAEAERCEPRFSCAVSAGTMASSRGSAIAAPKVPRRNVRRDECFFVMIMAAWPSLRRDCDSIRGPFGSSRVRI